MRKVFFLLMLISMCAVAQKTSLINSGSLIKEGIKLHDDAKYEQALAKYNLVDRNDTNYSLALVEKALTYNALKQYENTVKTCFESLKYSSDNISEIYNTLGTAYDELGQSEKAIEAYKTGSKHAPYYYLLYYNIALTYSRLEKFDSSIVYAKKAVDCNIYHASSHLLLGNIYHRRQLYAQAMLSFEMFLLIEPSSKRSANALYLLISTCQVNEITDPLSFSIPEEDKIFDNLNEIIKSKVALNEKYKTPVKKLKDPLINQLYVMIEKLETSDDLSNFWHRNYTKFFKAIYKEDYFLPQTYIVLSTVNSKKIQKEISKKLSKLESYKKWAAETLNNIKSSRYLYFNGKNQKVTAWYEANNSLSLGEVKDKQAKKAVLIGPWELYYNNGSKYGIEEYNNDGKAIGKWQFFYPSGIIKKEQHFKEDELYEMKRYFEDGILKTHSTRTGNANDYNMKYFYSTGLLKTEENYINDKKNGKSFSNYQSGEKLSESILKDDEETSYTEYFVSGSVKTKLAPKGDKLSELIFYFENGNVSGQGDLLAGKQSGIWKSFYEDGDLKRYEKYGNDGSILDTAYEYYPKGIKSTITPYLKGKKNGTVIGNDHDGKRHYEIVYKNDEPVSYKYFDKTGAVVSSSESKRGTLEFKSTFPTGETDAIGVMKDGKREGVWKYFYRIGTLKKEENYSKNELEGPTKGYFDNGLIQYEYNLKNSKADGYYKRYFANGNIEKEGWYINDKAEGYWFSYNSLGKYESVNYYLHDNMLGVQQDFKIDGILSNERYISQDLLRKYIFFDTTGRATDTSYVKSGNGTIKQFRAGKKLLREFTFVNGLITGTLKTYHGNGQVYEETEYKGGKQNGPVKFYDYKGILTVSGHYKEGNRDGEWKWYKNAKLKSSGLYKNGDKAGLWSYFSENGKLEETDEHNERNEIISISFFMESGELVITKKYDHGMFYAYTYHDKNNKLVPDIFVKNETGLVTAYFPNGKKSIEQEYKTGSIVGTSLRYYPNGNKFIEAPLKYTGDTEGLKKIFWPDNKIKSEEMYSLNDRHGECKYYRQDGSLEHTEMFYLGVRHGESDYFDNKGTKIRQEKYQYDMFDE